MSTYAAVSIFEIGTEDEVEFSTPVLDGGVVNFIRRDINSFEVRNQMIDKVNAFTGLKYRFSLNKAVS